MDETIDFYPVSAETREQMAVNAVRYHKARLEQSLDLLEEFRGKASTDGIEYELNSIAKFYKSKLYDLRHIQLDS